MQNLTKTKLRGAPIKQWLWIAPLRPININGNEQESQGGEGAVYHWPLALIEEICLDHISQLGHNICLVQNIHDGLNWILELEHPPRVSASCEVFWVLVFVPTLRASIEMSSSQRDSFELQLHRPETCLVMKERNSLGGTPRRPDRTPSTISYQNVQIRWSLFYWTTS